MTRVITELQGQKERRLGAFFGLINVFFSLSSRLLLIPIILHYLDRNEFGLYQLIGALAGYFALVDFGISGTLTRFIANYKAQKDRIRQENVFAMCLILYSFLALAMIVMGFILYHNLDVMFSKSLSLSDLEVAKSMFIILLFSVCATFLSRAFVGVNAGHERFVFSRVTDSVCMMIKVFVVTAILSLGHRAIGIVAVEALINLVILILNVGYAVIALKVRFKLHYWDWSVFVDVLGFAFWTFLAAVVLQINFRLGTFLLGVMTTTGLVATYAIALQINTLYNMVPTTISTVFLPKITRLVVDNADGTELTQTIVGPSRYQLMLLGGILVGFILFGRQFISLWAGPEYVEAWATVLFILVPVTIPLCQNTVLSVLYAKMLNRTRAVITLGFAVVNCFVAICFVRVFGLYGPAISTGLALLLGHGIVLNVYYHYCVGLDMILFFRKISEGIVIVIIGVLLAGSAINYLPVGDGWMGLIIRLNTFAAIYTLFMWFYGMHESEKSIFRKMFIKILKGKTVATTQEVKIK